MRRAGACLRLVVLPAVVVAVAASCADPAPAARASTVRALPTVMQDDAQLLYGSSAHVASVAHTMRALGVSWVRLTASWSALAPQSSAHVEPSFDASDPAAYGQAAWASLDRAVRAVTAAGMRPMLDIAFWAPAWATRDALFPRSRTDIDIADYRAFATAVARRYSGHYEPAGAAAPLPRVPRYTIWNEPNNGGFLLPQRRGAAPVSPTTYRGMVIAAYAAIERADDRAQVLIGGLAPYGGGTGEHSVVAPLAFLRALACVDKRLRPVHSGACGDFTRIPGDGWAAHPYSRSSPGTRATGGPDDAPIARIGGLTTLLAALVHRHRLAPRLADVYITEFGYSTPPARRAFSLAQQALFLPWAEDLAARNPHIRSFAQFLLEDAGPSIGGIGIPESSGLLSLDAEPKPAFLAFAVGLHVQATHDGIRMWARVRPDEPVSAMRLETRTSSRHWATTGTAQAPASHTVRTFRPLRNTAVRWARRSGRHGVRARYRLAYRVAGQWRHGPAVQATR